MPEYVEGLVGLEGAQAAAGGAGGVEDKALPKVERPPRVTRGYTKPMPETNPAMEFNPKAEVISSPAITMLQSIIREKTTTQRDFVNAADRLMTMLAEEGLARFCRPKKVVTPTGVFDGVEPLPTHQITGVDIIRSGGILLEALRRVAPDSSSAKILIQRDEATAEPKLFYSSLPENILDHKVLLCDPMLATGGSAAMAIKVLTDAGVSEENMIFLNVLSCPEGLRKLAEVCPGVRIVTAGVDEGLSAGKFIVPGLGDFGDRYYGTKGYKDGLWGTDGK